MEKNEVTDDEFTWAFLYQLSSLNSSATFIIVQLALIIALLITMLVKM